MSHISKIIHEANFPSLGEYMMNDNKLTFTSVVSVR
jgi:hypothetical protein